MNQEDLIKQLDRPVTPVREQEDVLPTGSLNLDILLGGGWPAGSVCELYGPPGYGPAVAYRTIAAVQAARPGRPVILCTSDFNSQLARKSGVSEMHLLVARTHDAVAAVTTDVGPALVIIDATVSVYVPVREDTQLTMLYLTSSIGNIRSSACVRLAPYKGTREWAWADRMWHTAYPGLLPYDRVPVSLGRKAQSEEILDAAVLLDVVTVRGRWHSYGSYHLGGSWEDAVHRMEDEPGLRGKILGEIAGQAPVYPGWRHAYL